MEVLRASQCNVLESSSPDMPAVPGKAPVAPIGEVGVRISEEKMQRSVEQANAMALIFNRSLKFEYQEEADIYQVSVIDTSKNEVVRKIPPDEVVRFIENIKYMFGVMLDIQA